MSFEVVVDGQYYSDDERCSHCGRPRPARKLVWNPKTERRENATTLCRTCQRRHCGTNPKHASRNGFSFVEDCEACRRGIPEAYACRLPKGRTP